MASRGTTQRYVGNRDTECHSRKSDCNTGNCWDNPLRFHRASISQSFASQVTLNAIPAAINNSKVSGPTTLGSAADAHVGLTALYRKIV